MVDGLANLTSTPPSFMGDSGRPSPQPNTGIPASQSRSRGRSYTTPGPSHFSDGNDASSSRPLSLPATSSSNYPPLDPSFSLMNQPAASQFPPMPDPSRTDARTGAHPYTGFSNILPAPPQFQQQPMWPFIPPQSQPYNAPLLDMSQTAMNPRLQGQSRHPAHGAGPSHISTTQHSGRILYSQSPSPGGFTPPQPPQDADEAAILEDKRRRNTAASARFRIKKKQKSYNLERTVSDLTLRAGELEKEASDLRRENAWLKEIVIMKGKGNKFGGQIPQAEESSSDSEDDSDDDTSSAEESDNNDSKRKGKGKSKSKDKRKDKKGKGKAKETDRDGRGKKGRRS